MRLSHLLATAAVLLPVVALAQPAAQTNYLPDANPTPPGGNRNIPGEMMLWCDDTSPILSQLCTPRVTSKAYRLPVDIGTAQLPATRSAAWLDASLTATTTASTPSGNLAAQVSRVGLHVWNSGTVLVCMAYGATPATTSATACAKGSVPIPAGSAYLEDQPGNVDPSSLAFVTFTGSADLTIKVR